MSYLVLARKWRPQLFEEVIGQKHVTKTLQNAITGNRVPHALLLTGSRGVGKTSIARILAKALNCHEGPTSQPCNQCLFCKEIAEGISMDVLEIDGASNTGVDDVRELRENVKYLPAGSRYKVYIIDEVHMLSNSAFNALLKTLEEPPRHIVFVFATTEPYKIPATIISRCQRYDFKRILSKDIHAQLRMIVSDEKILISDEGLTLIARKAEGSMRDALSILDQAISFSGKDVKDNEIIEILGIVDRKILYETSLSIIERNPGRCLDILEGVYNFGCDLKEFYKDLLEHFRNLVVVKIADNPSRLIDLPESEVLGLVEQGDLVEIDAIQHLFRILSSSEEEIIRSIHPKLIMEMTLVRMAHTRPIVSIDNIMDRMSNLERKIINLQENSSSDGERTPREESPSSSLRLQRTTDQENEAPMEEDDYSSRDVTSKKTEMNTEEMWPDLIGFVRKKRPLLASILEFSRLLHIDDGKIDIGFEEGSVFLDSMNEQGNRDDFLNICQDYFKREIAVSISAAALHSGSSSAPGKENGNGHMDAKTRRQEALNNPIIQDALNIFGGTITQIKIP